MKMLFHLMKQLFYELSRVRTSVWVCVCVCVCVFIIFIVRPDGPGLVPELIPIWFTEKVGVTDQSISCGKVHTPHFKDIDYFICDNTEYNHQTA